MMKYSTFIKVFLLTLFFSISTFLCSSSAESFPFRTIAPGDSIPDFGMTEVGGGSTSLVPAMQGKHAIVFFWGGDIPQKKERSTKAMTALVALTPFFTEKGFQPIIINVQNDGQDIITEVQQAAGLTSTTYLDNESQAYEQLGIFIMPSVLILDKNGKVVTGMGYSRNMSQRLQGEVEVFLGEKSAADLQAELHPKVVEKSTDEKKANRHLQMGLVLTRKGQTEAAVREFNTALAIKDDLAIAQAELGCAHLHLGNTDLALTALDAALDLDPESVRAEICLAQISAAQGQMNEAIADLRAMLFRNARKSSLHYALGQLYLQQKDYSNAAKEFNKAYTLLEQKMNMQHID